MSLQTFFITDKSTIAYLSHFRGTLGYLVMHKQKGLLFTDSRYHLVAENVLPRGFSLIDVTKGFKDAWKKFIKKNRIRTVGIEEDSITVHFLKYLKKISPHVRIVESGDHFRRLRMQKTSHELDCIIRAQEITDRILKTLRSMLKVGMSERHIAWLIESLAHGYGADDISFPPIVAFNENSASPHHQCSEKKLRKGDMILIDMGVVYKGYCSDMTRVLFTKTPTFEQKKIYEIVCAAQEGAQKQLKAGVTGKAADGWARGIIEKAGFGEKFGHSLGHGVGLDVHELPNLSQKYTARIPARAVVTIEPGIYLPGKFGVRLEDMVIVQKKGVKNITNSPKALKACQVRL